MSSGIGSPSLVSSINTCFVHHLCMESFICLINEQLFCTSSGMGSPSLVSSINSCFIHHLVWIPSSVYGVKNEGLSEEENGGEKVRQEKIREGIREGKGGEERGGQGILHYCNKIITVLLLRSTIQWLHVTKTTR